MSFSQPFSEAHSIKTAIQKEKQDGMSNGYSSPIKEGTEMQFQDGDGPMAPIEHLVPRRTHIHTRTDSLERKYASTGSNRGKETVSHKSYGSSEIGRRNLSGKGRG